uniref:Cytochrome P450 n=1 Tax=Acrobeloides nanus TaxID=290746 RepID=A0A914DF90_9BILA
MEKLTMNVIARAAFSLEVNAFQGEETEFFKEAKKFFKVNFMDPRLLFMITFPNVSKQIQQLTGCSLFMNKTNTFFKEMLGEILDQRRADKEAAEKYTDFFQLLLNALDEGNDSQNEKLSTEDSDIIHGDTENGGGKWKKSISRIEILAQSFLVLIAGYETTATTLHMIIYMLAKLPEIQDRLRDEINNILEDREDIGYDDITKFQYMNQVIFETLRMYPVATRANRLCTKPITINGIEFKENFTFSIPIYAIHHDEKYYPNPDEFDPERCVLLKLLS